jgi:hypothetical protein
MSPSGDRIAVPTNGHRSPHKDAEVGTHLAESTDLGAGGPEDEPADAPDTSPITPTVTSVPPVSPAALAAGFGVIAAIVVLLLGRRVGRRD